MARLTFRRLSGRDAVGVHDEGTWMDVGSEQELPVRGRLVRDVPALRQEIVVLRTRRSVFAFANRCPHRGRRLVDAVLRRNMIVCGGHGWKLRLDDGSCPARPNAARLRIFEASIVQGRVYLRIPARPPELPLVQPAKVARK